MLIDVCCLGILVADVSTVPVNNLPNAGELSIVDNISLGLGGCAANTATDLQIIGLKTAVIGKVGNDSFGSFITKTLADHGINITGIRKSHIVPTSSAIVLISGNGERSFLHCRGTNGDFQELDVDYEMIRNSKILFIAGALLLPKLDGEPTARILKHAQECGVYTVLDTAWDASGRWMDTIAPCLPYLDLFIPSLEEARMLSGQSDVPQMADTFLNRGVKLCVIKMGKSGCYVKNKDGEAFYSPSYERIKAKDTTGAGDSFVAGFLTGLSKEWDIRTCAKFANAVGAHCVSQMGTTKGIRPLEDILFFMEEYAAGNDIIK